ncbi:MAG: isochorismatase family protein [Cellulomonas sp.]|jgi:nicotinamidase-related amidase|uniref:isochorismatase family protein n=1 Tax=Cellulomonas sp. TaxID=40001 RepID=UPI001A0CCBA7|nr:isochorismatase family protein [Cellulomonas sp.]MBF0687509.1 isochorismatase family protein [Cellulomonas sp.]
MTVPEPLTPESTTIVMIDHAVGFANLLRSHDLGTHINNTVGLAKTALLFGSGLVVTNGVKGKPSGPLYPELTDVLGDHPVIERPGATNAFDDAAFAEAVAATGRRKLAIAGVSTEGCVLQSVLGALRLDYEVNLIVDASGSLTRETHDTAVQRMIQAGAVPTTWYSLAGEFEYDHTSPRGPILQQIMREHQPAMAKGVQTYLATKTA